MAKSIVDFEDRIHAAKKEYDKALALTLQLTKGQPSHDEVLASVTHLHSKAVEFFNLFERSIDEYGLDEYSLNEDKRKTKIDDALPVAQTIISHWNMLYKLEKDFVILIPKPTKRAYSSIQRLLNVPENKSEAEKLKTQFSEAKLPIDGFADKPHTAMTKKQQVTYSIISGTIFLLIMLALVVFIKCPTEAQAKIFSVVLALAAASYAAAIPGFLEVKYSAAITAGGALGVFVIVFFWEPANIKNLKHCPGEDTLSGTLYFGNDPLSGASISLVRQNQFDETNGSGNFTFIVDLNADDEDFRIKVKKEEINLDTVLFVKKEGLKSSIDLVVKKYCVECEHTDSVGSVIGVKTACSASKKYVRDFKKGFTRRGDENKYKTNCVFSEQP